MVQRNKGGSTRRVRNAAERAIKESLSNTLQSLNARKHPINNAMVRFRKYHYTQR